MIGIKHYLDLQLTPENILKIITPYDIFLKYAGNFTPNKPFCSPLRKDRTPSFSIQEYKGDWFYKDFSNGQSGNCFQFVQAKFNYTFKEALNVINVDFNLGLRSNSILPLDLLKQRTDTIKVDIKPKERKFIRIKSQDFTKEDLEYWNSFGITLNTLQKFNVSSITHYWINEYMFEAKEMCFAYRFNPYVYKIYKPNAMKGFKWYSNTNESIVQGYKQLEFKTQDLIITKSLKDVMCLDELGYEAIAPQSENVMLREELIRKLKIHYKNIYCLMDYDNAGIHLSWKMRKLYDIKPIFLTDKIWNRGKGLGGSKDLSDYIKINGKERTKQLIKSFRIGL